MTKSTFQPDAIDYAEALTAINLMNPKTQARCGHTLAILQGVKVAYIEGERTTFSRLAYSKAKAMALKHAPAPRK